MEQEENLKRSADTVRASDASDAPAKKQRPSTEDSDSEEVSCTPPVSAASRAGQQTPGASSSSGQHTPAHQTAGADGKTSGEMMPPPSSQSSSASVGAQGSAQKSSAAQHKLTPDASTSPHVKSPSRQPRDSLAAKKFAAAKMAAKAKPLAPPADDDSDSDTDSDAEETAQIKAAEKARKEKEAKKNKIPEWAKGEALATALRSQGPQDPDSIFYPTTHCELAAIFTAKKGAAGSVEPVPYSSDEYREKLGKRGSSGNWGADRHNYELVQEYKAKMGFLS